MVQTEIIKDSDCPIKKAVETNKKLIQKITGGVEDDNSKVKKKEPTPIKKLYPSYSKIALLLGSIILFGSMLATFFVPDIGEVIMVIIKDIIPSFDDSTGMEFFVN